MSTGKEVGKLYAYFLEASKRFIHFEIHVTREYDFLVKECIRIWYKGYLMVIMTHIQG